MSPPVPHLWMCLFVSILSAHCASADDERRLVKPSVECACSGDEEKFSSFGCKHVAGGQGMEKIFSCNADEEGTGNTRSRSTQYELRTDLLSWEDARRACQAEKGDLAVIHSAADARIIENKFRENDNISREDWINNQAWIGVTDKATEGLFLTVAGQTLKAAGWEKWTQYEPNNALGGEDCVTFTRMGALNDMKCTHLIPFFCEIEHSLR